MISEPLNLKMISDTDLINEAKLTALREKEATLALLDLFREIEASRLYLELGYSSLFEFALKHCGLSEGSAHRRISAMRLLKVEPLTKEKLKSGELSVTNAARIFSTLKKENITTSEKRKEVIEKCLRSTQKECERTLREFFPPPEDTVEVKLVVPRIIAEKLEKLKFLTSHRNPEMSTEKLFTHLVEAELRRQEATRQEKKFHSKEAEPSDSSVTDRFTSTVEVTSDRVISANASAGKVTSLSSHENLASKKGRIRRRIPLPLTVRQNVYARASHKCQFPGCESRYRLEIDPITPIAHGGSDSSENLRVLCGTHHRHVTEEAQVRFH